MKQEEQFLNIQLKDSQTVVDKKYLHHLHTTIFSLKENLNKLIRDITYIQDTYTYTYEVFDTDMNLTQNGKKDI